MGRRSRKRSVPPSPVPEVRAGGADPARTGQGGGPKSTRARLDEAPAAPWAPVPLVELCVLSGLVLIGFGVLGGGDRSGLLIACGIALAALAGLELSVREHFAGYRSHSTVLAGALALVSAIPLFFLTALPQPVLLVVAVAVFGGAFLLLRRAFQARSGGIGFRA